MRYNLFITFVYTNFIIGLAPVCSAQQLPIQPSRTISFTTNEGSYMNVDVSPDGNTLLFDLLGDIYSVPTTGGNATQLTRGISLNLRPIWSPDGKMFSYISDISGDFHLNIMNLNGTFHRVLGKSGKVLNYWQDVLWMPGGNYIFTGGSIYALSGGNMTPRPNIGNPVRFSTDRKYVYYLDSQTLYHYDYTTYTKTILAPISRGYRSGNISPDGRWWAYVKDTGYSTRCLIIRDLLKNTERITTISAHKPDIPSLHFSFSPDSKSIFIGFGGKIHHINAENGVDQVIPFIAKVKSNLGPYNYNTFRILNNSVKIKYTRAANASPDGKHLVFSALSKLYVMDLPDGKPHELIRQSMGQFQPVYSPDGQWIAYVSWCDTVGGHLWRVSASGGQPEKLSSIPGQYQRPAWSPDGTFIAIVKGAPKLGDRDDPGIGQLELVPVNGGPVRIIEDSVPLWNQLAFSSNGTKVIYQPQYRENSKSLLSPLLVSRDLNGKNLQILCIGAYFSFLQQRSLSPDGRFIVYSAGEDLYLIPACKLTTPQIIYDPSQNLPVIKFAQGVDPNWEEGGKLLSWTYSNRFYRVRPEKIIATAEKIIRQTEISGLSDNSYIRAKVIPDQVVKLDITVPEFYAHGLIAFRNVRIVTMQRDKVIEHGTIIIKDGRFIAIGPVDIVPIPSGAKLFDLPGTTVIPGFIDLHLHMRIPPDVFPQQSWMFLANLAYGVTTARDPSLNFDSFGYKEMLESGQMIGPRLYSVGRAARIPDGMVRCDNIDDARALVHKRAILGGTVIKQYMLPKRIQRQWLLIASREAGLNMTNEGDYDPILQFGMIKDGSTGVEHNPQWGDVYKDVISFVAASGTYLTPALQVCYGEDEAKEYFNYKYWHQPDRKLIHFAYSDSLEGPSNVAESLETILKANPKDTAYPGFKNLSIIDNRIRKQGGRVTLGSHGDDEGIGVHNELWALQMGGISNMESLQAATIMGAEALGIQKDLGSINVGKIADLIILNKNPLDDIHNSREIRYVMKGGILYNGDNLDIIWPMVKKCPKWKLTRKTP